MTPLLVIGLTLSGLATLIIFAALYLNRKPAPRPPKYLFRIFRDTHGRWHWTCLRTATGHICARGPADGYRFRLTLLAALHAWQRANRDFTFDVVDVDQ